LLYKLQQRMMLIVNQYWTGYYSIPTS